MDGPFSAKHLPFSAVKVRKKKKERKKEKKIHHPRTKKKTSLKE